MSRFEVGAGLTAEKIDALERNFASIIQELRSAVHPRVDPAGSPEFVADWDVFRDQDGKPVTITWEQVRAVWHAVHVVERVRRAEGHPSLWHIRPPNGINQAGFEVSSQGEPELAKSRLLGRMLVSGLPPTKTKPPPLEVGGPAWWALPDGDPFAEA